MDFIGFDELIIIVVIALIVLGPVRTFKLMFSLGHFFAKARNYLNSVKTQLQLDEIRQEVSVIRKNDFHDTVNRISPSAADSSHHNVKRQWTVTADDFREKDEKSSDRNDVPKDRVQTDDKKNNSDSLQLTERVEKLEQEIAKLKEKIAQ